MKLGLHIAADSLVAERDGYKSNQWFNYSVFAVCSLLFTLTKSKISNLKFQIQRFVSI